MCRREGEGAKGFKEGRNKRGGWIPWIPEEGGEGQDSSWEGRRDGAMGRHWRVHYVWGEA